jgi:hypothetical protein
MCEAADGVTRAVLAESPNLDAGLTPMLNNFFCRSSSVFMCRMHHHATMSKSVSLIEATVPPVWAMQTFHKPERHYDEKGHHKPNHSIIRND